MIRLRNFLKPCRKYNFHVEFFPLNYNYGVFSRFVRKKNHVAVTQYVLKSARINSSIKELGVVTK